MINIFIFNILYHYYFNLLTLIYFINLYCNLLNQKNISNFINKIFILILFSLLLVFTIIIYLLYLFKEFNIFQEISTPILMNMSITFYNFISIAISFIESFILKYC